MADTTNPIESTANNDLTDILEKTEQKEKDLEARLRDINRLVKTVGDSSSDTAKIQKAGYEAAIELVNKQKNSVHDLHEAIRTQTVGVQKAKEQWNMFGKGINDSIASAQKYKDSMTKSLGDVGGGLKKVGQTLDSTIPYATAKAQESVLKSLDNMTYGILSAQKESYAFKKELLTLGTSFGQTYDQAKAAVPKFMDSFKSVRDLIKATPADMDKVRVALKDVMPIETQIAALEGLDRAHAKLAAPLNATSAALLVSYAKNMDAAKAAEWMGKAVTELSATTEEAALNFSRIAFAAEGSGLSFSRVGDSIMNAAESLKLWGGTVSSVAPLFKAFSDSLSGVGQKGLTPQLLQSFVTGISQMSFGVKALVGMQMPGGASKGPIEAAFDIEDALSEGASGMERVTSSLIQTMKQYTGGRIITAEERRQDPNLTYSFLMQRQLLGSLTKITDPAVANKTLAMLQTVDKNGLKVGDDTQGKLAEILKSGKDIQTDTKDALTLASDQTTEAIRDSIPKLIDVLHTRASEVGLSRGVDGIKQAVQNLISGKTGISDVSKSTTGWFGKLSKWLKGEKSTTEPSIKGGETLQKALEGAEKLNAQAKRLSETKQEAGKEPGTRAEKTQEKTIKETKEKTPEQIRSEAIRATKEIKQIAEGPRRSIIEKNLGSLLPKAFESIKEMGRGHVAIQAESKTPEMQRVFNSQQQFLMKLLNINKESANKTLEFFRTKEKSTEPVGVTDNIKNIIMQGQLRERQLSRIRIPTETTPIMPKERPRASIERFDNEKAREQVLPFPSLQPPVLGAARETAKMKETREKVTQEKELQLTVKLIPEVKQNPNGTFTVSAKIDQSEINKGYRALRVDSIH